MIEHFIRFILQQFSVVQFPLQKKKYDQTKNREENKY